MKLYALNLLVVNFNDAQRKLALSTNLELSRKTYGSLAALLVKRKVSQHVNDYAVGLNKVRFFPYSERSVQRPIIRGEILALDIGCVPSRARGKIFKPHTRLGIPRCS